MKTPIEDLASMALFARVVQLRSFSATARELEMVKSASASGSRCSRSGSACAC